MGNKDRRREARDGEINRLKKAIRRLESDKRKLLSELRTLEEAFGKNVQFLRGKTADLSVEELINAAKKQQTLEEIEQEKNTKFEDMESRWKCFKCETGIMKLIIYTNRDGRFYIRCCSNIKCGNRTRPQEYHEKVEGIRQV